MTTDREGRDEGPARAPCFEERIKALEARLLEEQEGRRLAEARLHAVVGSVVDAIITIDEMGLIKGYNPAAEHIFGYSAHEAIGQNVCLLMPEEYRPRHEHGLERYRATRQATIIGTCVEVTGQHKDGALIPIELTISEISVESDRAFVGIIRDITERKQAEERIRYLAHHDTLTGLPNRNMFSVHFARALARARRSRSDLALLYLDLDGFKPVNDKYGHHTGDALLREVAERFKRAVRATDTVARVGGDEFIAILEVINGRDNAAMLAERLISAVNAPFHYQGHDIWVGVSIGISLFPQDADQTEALLAAADAAMYAVKERGRNAYRFCDDGYKQRSEGTPD